MSSRFFVVGLSVIFAVYLIAFVIITEKAEGEAREREEEVKTLVEMTVGEKGAVILESKLESYEVLINGDVYFVKVFDNTKEIEYIRLGSKIIYHKNDVPGT